jgi:predicted dehydrogenase
VTVRWGIVGPGRIAAEFATGMQEVADGEVVAVASRAIERANTFADRFGVERRYDGIRALVDDAEVDVVYVATPHARHCVDTIAALEAGKHVLCEKPFALNARQAAEMVDTARARGVFLMEAMWSRFLPAYRVLTEVLADQRIGDPTVVEADFGFRMPVVPEHRLFDPALGGGALLDLGVYALQLCSLVLGVPDRVRADATVGETGVDERVAAVLGYRNGSMGVIKAAITASLACEARISGTDGWIRLPAFMHRPEWIEVGTARGVERIDAGFEGEGLRFQVMEVHRCLAEGQLESPVMPLDETVAIASVLDEIRRQIGVVYPDD